MNRTRADLDGTVRTITRATLETLSKPAALIALSLLIGLLSACEGGGGGGY
ncbi:MAG: hypothetical protein WD314_08350 [Trueperaceae bacterium]